MFGDGRERGTMGSFRDEELEVDSTGESSDVGIGGRFVQCAARIIPCAG